MTLPPNTSILASTAVFSALLAEAKTGFDAIIELAVVHDTRAKQAQLRIDQLEEEIHHLKHRLTAQDNPPHAPKST